MTKSKDEENNKKEIGRDIEEIFSENLRKYRKEKNLTQGELAELVGVDKNMVQKWESGILPKVGNIKEIAMRLGIYQSHLFFDEAAIPPINAIRVLCHYLQIDLRDSENSKKS